jgi:hypothetical protein
MARSSKKSGFLRELLRRDNLKWNWDATAADCVADPRLIPHLVDLCTDDELPVQRNAGAVTAKIVDIEPALLTPHLPKFVQILKTNPHDAVKRAIMRVFQTVEIPEAIEGEVFDHAMKFLADDGAAIAIRAYSMTIARRFCQRYPTLRHELIPVVKQLLEHECPTAVLTRARKDLRTLEALSDDKV